MKAMVVYDSAYGNTEQIARAIAGGLGRPEEVRLSRAGTIRPQDLEGMEILVVGSPTQAGRPTRPVQVFLDGLAGATLKGVHVAAFDTRMAGRFARIFGYAAGRIGRSLEKSGGQVLAQGEGFFVEGKEGPLRPGELERAERWAEKISAVPAE